MKKISIITIVLIVAVNSFNAQTDGTLNDSRDGKIYKTIEIEDQIWMAENMAFKTENGCLSYDYDIQNVSKYGYLYSLATAKNVCPSGWHLPSREEFELLIENLGGEDNAAYNLKSTKGWIYEGKNYGVNSSGFNALQTGIHYNDDDSFYNDATVFWSNTPDGKEKAWFLSLYLDLYNVDLDAGKPIFDAYVRCIKD